MLQEKLVKFIEDSIKANWDINALADYDGKSLTYKDTGEQILKLQLLFEKSGIKRGDKIALLGNNSANWGVVYLATITYGAVIVPILPELGADNIHHIIEHSDSVLFFITEQVWDIVDTQKMPDLKAVISLEIFSLLHSNDKKTASTFENLDNLFAKNTPTAYQRKISHSRRSKMMNWL